MECSCIITDSGGIQKEADLLRKKCITLRSETEWVETLNSGCNILIFNDLSNIKEAIMLVPGDYTENLFGFGNSSDLIAEILNKKLNFAN